MRPVWTLLIAVLVSACGTPNAPPSPSPLTAPGVYTGVAWSAAFGVVVSYATRDWLARDRLASIRDGGLDPITTGGLPGCATTSANAPLSLGDDRVAYVATCLDDLEPTVSAIEETSADGSSRVLFDTAPRVVTAGPITANPDASRFALGYGGAFCSTIVWVDATGSHLIPWVIGDPPRQFRLDIEPDRTGDCADAAWVDQPSFSPDGSTLAFFASPDAMGNLGQARLEARRGLYLADPSTGDARLLLDGIRDPRGLAFAHDGHRLAFAGQLGDGSVGTWSLDVASSDPELVSTTKFEWLAWSPDDTQLVGLAPGAIADDPLLDGVVVVAVP
jgi:WD40-like Beta Propeller Repeat